MGRRAAALWSEVNVANRCICKSLHISVEAKCTNTLTALQNIIHNHVLLEVYTEYVPFCKCFTGKVCILHKAQEMITPCSMEDGLQNGRGYQVS